MGPLAQRNIRNGISFGTNSSSRLGNVWLGSNENSAIDVRQCFQPVIGTWPWKVKFGVAALLTLKLDRASRPSATSKANGTFGIYLSNWKLFHGDRLLVHSNADRKPMTVATRRLGEEVLSAVDFDPRAQETFSFSMIFAWSFLPPITCRVPTTEIVIGFSTCRITRCCRLDLPGFA